VILELGVEAEFDVDRERERRVAFLGDYLASQGLHGNLGAL
jgi:NAD+ synthase